MKTINQVSIQPQYIEHMPDILEEAIIYISLEYQTASHLCLCGCKSLVVTPLGPNWWSIVNNSGKLTMTPSIGSFQLPCQSHYIITNNIANFI